MSADTADLAITATVTARELRFEKVPNPTTIDRNPEILQRLLQSVDNTAGTVVSQRTVGNVLDLRTLSETTNDVGQTVRRVTDTSGAVIELTLDAAGKVLNSRVVSQATRQR